MNLKDNGKAVYNIKYLAAKPVYFFTALKICKVAFLCGVIKKQLGTGG